MSLDLDAYFARIGYAGDRAPTLPVLRDLIARHTSSIAFENIDVLAGRPPALNLEALTGKLVRQRRGGYCFEQNTLFITALRALGFRVAGLIAQVRRGSPPEVERQRSHMILRVELPEGPYLADVGYGGLTPTAPLALRTGVEQDTPHERLRLVETGDEITLQAEVGADWEDIYRFGPQVQRPVDYEVANWFTATWPQGLFVNNVVATIPVPGGRRVLFNRRLTHYASGQPVSRDILRSSADYRQVLHDTFGLEIAADDLNAVMAVAERHDPDTPATGSFA